MFSIQELDFNNTDLLQPIIEAYVAVHKSLAFNPNYWTIFADYIKNIETDDCKLAFIAKDNDKVMGLIIGAIDDNARTLLPNKIGYIPFLAVLPEYKRKGVAKELLNKLLKWYEAQNIKEIELYTALDNTEARAFWQNFNFETYLERRKLIVE
ncbi:GNAT family N-acetyltransferase [Geosporobacter ferrireducens]|uniref:N-acetyltransferase domain-containing protein n=1 Tax=Geosporobacter ferrireducens TaxID=1424294 RepID=A0A1D8GK09_9FIRM|nr:GNAT family N-acetyltransferase [Geosporobacter ferrireducens]AOT71247.1 hypothetical protein Gferi_17820 [Geosporobacter ferrireducens]